MLRKSLIASTLAVALLGAGHVHAADNTAIEGSYLLVQDDTNKRVLSLAPNGNISQVSDQEALIGFTAGLGTWTRTGSDTAVATLVNFNHDVAETEGGDGASRIVFELTFSDALDGRYQSVTGSYSGKTFEEDQNPLASTQEPVRVFASGFSGQRINAGSEDAEPA